MSLPRILLASLFALLLSGAAQAQGLLPVPALAHRVTDQAAMLDANQRARLEAQLADYEAKTGSQIAVLTVKSTAPEQIEQYGIRVFDAWKLGRKQGIDDGVLLLIAPENTSAMRRLRIEAGRGVQGVLTDAKSKQVLQDIIAPHFREKQYYEGLVAGVSAIETLLNTEKFPPPKAPVRSQQQSGGTSLPMPLLFFGVLVLLWLFRPRGGTQLASNGWGSGATGFIIGSVLDSALHNRGGGSSGDGGFSDGGSFSGGGGSADGGGASGDW
ncbi:MAG: TPM domain-containing protein [Pseudomonadota bacterium]